ncbi:T9SS type A sorting domain-containing protein [Hymenobacter metallilatus]|uniref:T9SS C-terminal target domain-containing protein n=1 Tax=Hymenobacter metallilatus TaxID=2493666 RepID=A0A3R9LUV9_9BACT|nr:T9SS type A sorting domain-containing protein [Hymenobacter metallilatus]RSK23989.1 T9SS C-terminal target domain-containing protein [Hymenobacter metallilatus]
MKKTQLLGEGFRPAWLLTMVLLMLAGPLRAQEACLLEAVPLAQRLEQATLVVEARVKATRSQDTGAHIFTFNELEVFKVFAGTMPPGPLTVVTAGGTVGLRREEVSNEPVLGPDEQGIFLLEPSPNQPGRFRLTAGPQGLIRYNLPTATASDPFRRYASIPGEVYAALEQLTGRPYAPLQPNHVLETRLRESARPGAAAVVTGFTPAAVAAGTGTVLTITGTGFGAVQGNSTVGFANANTGGSSYVTPLAVDYLSWSDTEIRVRVPSVTVGGAGPAGTGKIQLTVGGAVALSPEALTVQYALSNLQYQDAPYAVAMVGTNGAGGYTLTYNENFAANAAAKAAFERALATWRNGTGANRIVAPATTPVNSNISNDNINVVAFDDAAELAAGVLGVTYSYYTGCSGGSGISWVLTGTDYIFDGERSWQFGPAAPTGGQFDFESVALHEQGHGIQLGHIIKPGAVMHYAIAANSQNRVLNATSEVAGATAEIDLSLVAPRCGNAAYARLASALPVTLVRFEAIRSSAGVRVSWETAAEVNSAYFAVEATVNPAGQWQELARQPAAGTSNTPRSYTYLDQQPRPTQRYYRLRQQDADGTVYYSGVVAVAADEVAELGAYPNPFTDVLQVQLPSPAAAVLTLYDASGRRVLQQPVAQGQQLPTLSGATLRPGVYLLEWQSVTGQKSRIRVLKQ